METLWRAYGGRLVVAVILLALFGLSNAVTLFPRADRPIVLVSALVLAAAIWWRVRVARRPRERSE